MSKKSKIVGIEEGLWPDPERRALAVEIHRKWLGKYPGIPIEDAIKLDICTLELNAKRRELRSLTKMAQVDTLLRLMEPYAQDNPEITVREVLELESKKRAAGKAK